MDDLSRQMQALEQEIAEIQAELAAARRESARLALAQELAEKQRELERLTVSFGSDNSFDQSNVAVAASPGGDLNQTLVSGGVNAPGGQFGAHAMLAGRDIINNFFGGQTPVNGEELLHEYLKTAILEQYEMVRLQRLTTKSQSGNESDPIPQLQLLDIYANLKLENVVVHTSSVRTEAKARKIVDRLKNRDSKDILPEWWLAISIEPVVQHRPEWFPQHHEILEEVPNQSDEFPNEEVVIVDLKRPLLASEALAPRRQKDRLVGRTILLGDPGWGKSTVLQYTAVRLARSIVSGEALPRGWNRPLIPIVCPLAVVADALQKDQDVNDLDVLWRVIEQQLEGQTRSGLGTYVREAARHAGVALFFDGLDEVSPESLEDGRSLRSRIAAAIMLLGHAVPRKLPIVVTSRVQPYHDQAVEGVNRWSFSTDDDWQIHQLAALEWSQVRRFIQVWYAKSIDSHRYTRQQANQRAANLYTQLLDRTALHELVQSPLLLTMTTILHYNRDDELLPTGEAELYEAFVSLLLDRWEPVRTIAKYQPGLIELLGLKNIADIHSVRTVLEDVAFIAHDRPQDASQRRGVLSAKELNAELQEFFETLECDRIKERRATFIKVLREKAGLLQEIGDQRYCFPHLTFQEYLAACRLARLPNAVREAYRVWDGASGDQWRKVLLLFAGRVQADKMQLLGIPWLKALLNDVTPLGVEKNAAQRQRDALLAADMYELWPRGALQSLGKRDLQRVREDLQTALEEIRSDQTHPLPVQDRVRAGLWLGRWFDYAPFPEWVEVPAGTFMMGSDSTKDEHAKADEKPHHLVSLPAYRIAKYPTTNAQYAHFINAGGYTDERWWNWSNQALAWYHQHKHQQPSRISNERFSNPLQPVAGVSWYQAVAYTRWLAATMHAHGTLSVAETVRLPSEAEWEYAARGFDGRIYSWGNSWNADHANSEESGIGVPTPVGCFPAGASIWRVMDMLGNVWEWCANTYYTYVYETASLDWQSDARRMIRGGAHYRNNIKLRCAARARHLPGLVFNFDLGFRCVVVQHS